MTYVHSSFERYKDCGWAKDNLTPRTLILPMHLYSQLISLLQEFQKEFMLYFEATETEAGDWEIHSIVIPEQEVTTGSVEATEQVLGVEGVFHSHAHMGSFMSGTDDSYINMNHHFSIVGNRKGEFKGVTREDLPCGAVHLVEAKLLIIDPEDNRTLIEEAKKKIKDKVHVTQVQQIQAPFTRGTTIYNQGEDPNSPKGKVVHFTDGKPNGAKTKEELEKDKTLPST